MTTKVNKEDIHKKIDDTFNNLIKQFDNICEKIKFNNTQTIEETNNLEVLTSTEAIGLRLNDLIKIINDMKVEHLKASESDNKYKKTKNEIGLLQQEICKKIAQLQEIYNISNTFIKECKQNKFYKYSLNYKFE